MIGAAWGLDYLHEGVPEVQVSPKAMFFLYKTKNALSECLN